MEILKYPVEKIFYFVAGIIPGFVALWVFDLAHPGSFGRFLAIESLGYKTKLAIILVIAFVIGNSMTTFVSRLLAALGGAFGAVAAQRPYQPPHSFPVAPWRDRRWRTVLKNYLGSQAPNDTSPMSEQILEQRRKMAELLPESNRPLEFGKLNLEKINADIEDGKWAEWYDHYHQIVILDRHGRDVEWYVQRGLSFNLETAALYIVMSSFLVPGTRRWWWLLPSYFWVSIFVANQYSSLHQATNKWSTLSEQIKYLSEQRRASEI
jgi:hypothetical protein